MLVHPEQLVEKCILLKDIYGKTGYPIISKQTVINETHIKVLKDFLIKEVLVASKLANGLPYQPDKDNLAKNDEHLKTTSANIEKSSFLDQYLAGVKQYATIFKQLQSGSMLDVYEFRLLIQPLIEQIDQYKANIFLLSHHATEDMYIYHHSVSVGLLAAVLAKQLGFEQEMMQVALAAMIAD